MKVVVTGGAGFIGANTVRALMDTQRPVMEVVVLDDLSTGSLGNLDGINASVIEGSILDDEALNAACAGATSIVHLAARPSVPRSIEDPWSAHDVNATGAVKVLEAARRHGVRQVIAASSSSVYGANPTLPKQEDLPLRPVSPYAASKLATETYVLAWGRSYGIQTLALRFFNVFGPLQPAGHAYAAVIPAFMSAVIDGRPLPINGDGTQTRDFTFVGSVAALLAAGVAGNLGSDLPVNLAFGQRWSLLDVASELEQIVGHGLEKKFLPPRPGDVPHSQADTSRFHNVFSPPDPVDFGEALAQTYRWWRTAPT